MKSLGTQESARPLAQIFKANLLPCMPKMESLGRKGFLRLLGEI